PDELLLGRRPASVLRAGRRHVGGADRSALAFRRRRRAERGGGRSHRHRPRTREVSSLSRHTSSALETLRLILLDPIHWIRIQVETCVKLVPPKTLDTAGKID